MTIFSNIETPQDVLRRLREQRRPLQTSNSIRERSFANFDLLFQNLFGNPEVEKAERLQTSIADARRAADVEIDSLPEGASQIDKELVRLSKIRSAIQDDRPDIASQIDDRILGLALTKKEQQRLDANERRQERQADRADSLTEAQVAVMRATEARNKKKFGLEFQKMFNDLGLQEVDLELRQLQLAKARGSLGTAAPKDTAWVQLPGQEEPVFVPEDSLTPDMQRYRRGTLVDYGKWVQSRTDQKVYAAQKFYNTKDIREGMQAAGYLDRVFSSINGEVLANAPLDADGNPDLQAGLEQFFSETGPIEGRFDAFMEFFGATDTTDLQAKVKQLRVQLQDLLKGVPSDKDQFILDATRFDRVFNEANNVAAYKEMFALYRLGVQARVSHHLEQFKGVPMPATLEAMAHKLGIDVANPGSFIDTVTDMQGVVEGSDWVRRQSDPKPSIFRRGAEAAQSGARRLDNAIGGIGFTENGGT